MVQFGVTLEQQRNQDWKDYYIDYHGLKEQLKSLKAAYEAASAAQKLNQESQRPLSFSQQNHQRGYSFDRLPDRGSGGGGGGTEPSPSPTGRGFGGSRGSTVASRSLMRRLTSSYSLTVGEDIDELEEKFKAALDSEVEKVVLFFLSKQGDLAKLLLNVRRVPRPQCRGGVGDGVFIGEGAVDNLIAAAGGGGGGGEGGGMAGTQGTVGFNSSGGLISRETDRHSIYCGIGRQIAELMRFLQLNVSGLRKILKKHDKQVRDKLIAKNYLSTRAQEKYSSMRQLYNNSGVMALVGSLRNAFEVEEAEQAGDVRPADEERGLLRSTRASARALSEVSSTEGVLVEIANEQRALAKAQHLTTSRYLSLQVLLDGSGLSTVDEESERESKNRELHKPSAFINLATTFLYMTNYYIVGPTSAEYAAALGGSPAVSGLIIGMTPIAACFSCLLYSWWTNTSFRGPLVLCSVMLIIGNFLYGLALTYDAFWMVLVGRMLIGLGGARGVNRRYIADTIPIADRTLYSAAFVAAGAVGMAFGPALSAVSNGIDFSVAGVVFNGLTNPGWMMFILWLFMGVIVYYEFQEPPHYMNSGSSEGASDEEQTPTHDRRSIKGAAVADGRGKFDGGAYGSTAAARTAGAAGTKSGKHGAAATSDEKAKLLVGGTEADAKTVGPDGDDDNDDEDDDDDDDDDDDAFDAGTDLAAIATKEKEKNREQRKGSGGLGAITPPLAFCLFGYFVNKLITEAVVSSAPVLAQYMFDWSVREVGTLMAVLGIVVLPVNALVGRLSMDFEDRALLQALAALTGVGCLVLVDCRMWSPFAYTEAQYIAGVSVVFVALQAHEGVIMSVTSKIIPIELARGTWNSGFLATEAGTFGRFVGDALITLLGVMTLQWLDFLLFFPSALLVMVMMVGFWLVYPFLQGQ